MMAAASAAPEKQQLLDLIADLEASGGARGSSGAINVKEGRRLNELIEKLSALNPNPRAAREEREKLAGIWKLVVGLLVVGGVRSW